MIKIIWTSIFGVGLLSALSLFLVWIEEYSKKRAKAKYDRKFGFIDKYFSDMETASEKQMELRRRERETAFRQGKASGNEAMDADNVGASGAGI